MLNAYCFNKLQLPTSQSQWTSNHSSGNFSHYHNITSETELPAELQVTHLGDFLTVLITELAFYKPAERYGHTGAQRWCSALQNWRCTQLISEFSNSTRAKIQICHLPLHNLLQASEQLVRTKCRFKSSFPQRHRTTLEGQYSVCKAFVVKD